ncbi:hypothetical protein RRG08_021007 [Elysia crispata]|uniref:Uncharacterized protein n=1 Tax=Elysia crispata TaxID=231223 RepID=A0AAE1D3R1_9GAST|nr:hypothetical protein RRG08_021007 [Elysia crispata]
MNLIIFAQDITRLQASARKDVKICRSVGEHIPSAHSPRPWGHGQVNKILNVASSGCSTREEQVEEEEKKVWNNNLTLRAAIMWNISGHGTTNNLTLRAAIMWNISRGASRELGVESSNCSRAYIQEFDTPPVNQNNASLAGVGGYARSRQTGDWVCE